MQRDSEFKRTVYVVGAFLYSYETEKNYKIFVFQLPCNEPDFNLEKKKKKPKTENVLLMLSTFEYIFIIISDARVDDFILFIHGYHRQPGIYRCSYPRALSEIDRIDFLRIRVRVLLMIESFFFLLFLEYNVHRIF